MTAIVVVEDETDIGDLLALYFRQEGWTVHVADNGADGLEVIRARRPDFIVLDVGLPGELDGFDVCREVRRNSNTPILFLTARDDEIDRILGLEIGADDYVTKPFSPREIVARVKAIMRRGKDDPTRSDIRFETILIDLDRHEVTADDEPVALATQEWSLLAALAQHRGSVLSRQQLLDLAWGVDWIGD
ncbi:MAG: response regulator transcription factor, partial [Acidimicrobiia bacterium]|nr:response regulator transcription factor [Acidimicrobiia bacterium]